MEFKYLGESERLKLRPVAEGDLSFLLSLFNNPLAMKYYPALRNEEQTRKWIRNYIEQQLKLGYSKWLIETKFTSQPVGHCGLVPTDIDGVSEIELGYFLHPDFWGKGLATEAATTVLDVAKNRFQLKRVVSAINPANIPSVEVAKRLGMKKEKIGKASVADFTWEAEVWTIDF